MFKFFNVIVCITFFILNFSAANCWAASGLENITAKSAIVMDAKTGKVIYAKDAESRRYPASTTKMMTLIVALEKSDLNEVVTASEKASVTEGSSLWLEKDEKLRLLDLLYGIMLVSGNDATVAVAEHLAGTVENYAKLMTEKAHEIGATQTNFANSSGLPDPNHYSTAHDLAKIAAYGYKNPMFEQIVSTKTKIIPWAKHDFGRELFNENRMLWLYDGGNGVKTGYTDAAGRCLVSAANRNGIQLIAVVLDSEYMWNDSIALLNYGFEHVKSVNLFQKGEILKTSKVLSGKKDSVALSLDKDINIPVVDDEQNKFTTVIDAPDMIEAEIMKGQRLGTIRILYDNQEIESADLIANDTIDRKSFFIEIYKSFMQVIDYFKNQLR
ncbi:D-alanyl-D-alanine carboxypeptidase family protein [Anaerosinus massiliensis]|uniref:D-alanyl-D-alanine carboxypeptidase family protein n=1 Tax=Massilibacillus massiliensis TaxID=1806837 RepID=UPI000DA6345A|nr:D-alanyl-D-alanine carboxypeptidase family protein [Massilibacillus massiliensis]